MKLDDYNNSMDAILREYAIANSPWPQSDEEIDALLEVDAEADHYTKEERSARVKSVLRACGEEPVNGEGEQLVLFESDSPIPSPVKVRSRELFEIVALAYREIHEGWSSDRLIADPDMDARFIHACWRKGAQAPQSLLNHLLMNARKRKLLGGTEGAMHYRVKPEVMDQYVFASEFAARLVQGRVFQDKKRMITVDTVLCDPDLAREFDEIAKTISPGFTPLDYRWALFALRKAKSRHQQGTMPQLTFDWLGRLDSAKGVSVGPVAGFIWVKTAKAQVYIGHSHNLRNLFDRIMQARMDRILNDLPLFKSHVREPLELGISESPKSSVTSREPFKNMLVSQWKPHLNILQWKASRNPRKDDTNGETQRACGAA